MSVDPIKTARVVLAMMENLVTEYDITGYVRERSGAVLPGIAPSRRSTFFSETACCSAWSMPRGATVDLSAPRRARACSRPIAGSRRRAAPTPPRV